MQILSVDAFTAISGVKICVYGGAGAGKTKLIATLPKPIIISAENGLLSLRGANLPMIPPIKNLQDLWAAQRWIATDNQAKQFESVAIDSISDIAEVLLTVEKGRSANGQKAFGEMAESMQAVLKAFRDLNNKNVYFTCKEEYDKHFSTGATVYMPSVPGRVLPKELPYLFDELFRLHVIVDAATGQKTRWLQTDASPDSVAKDRSGALAPWEPPDLGAIIKKITAKG